MVATLLMSALMTGNPAPITVDPNIRHQQWEGWGTSLCWWAYVAGGASPKVREDIMQKFFGYLKMNIVRYNIGGGENPEHHHMEYRAQLPGCLTPDGKYNFEADPNQKWVLLRAKQLGANKFESFSNSPPYWMTISNCAAGGENGKDNLKPDMFDAFAKYLVDCNEYMRREWKIPFETLEPMNEPHVDWWKVNGRQEGCRFTMGPDQSRLIEAVDKYLKLAKSRTKIAASDESIIDTAVKSWDALSPNAKSLVWRINSHHYGGNQQIELQKRAAAFKKRLWMSEEGNNDPSGLTMADKIVEDMRDMKPNAWVYWQVIDTTGSNWGMIDMDLNHRGEEYVVHKKFYVMGNFSRFIRPGATIIDIGDKHSVAALKGRNLTIVTSNKGAERTVTFDLSRFKKLGKVEAFRTSATEELAPVALPAFKGTELTVNLPAKSVTTITVKVN